MKLQAEIDSKIRQLTVEKNGQNVSASIDGRQYELTVSEPEKGVFLVKNGNTIYEAIVDDGETSVVQIGTDSIKVKIIDPRQLRGGSGEGGSADGVAEIKTAMPGKVVRILRTLGETIEKGEGVIVVEAMKMQNEMRAPKSGVIKDIKVTEGDTVKAGALLIVIE